MKALRLRARRRAAGNHRGRAIPEASEALLLLLLGRFTHARLSSSPTENRMQRNAAPKHNRSLEESSSLNNELLGFYRF